MKMNELLAYVSDFVSLLLDNSDGKIKEIILFGSAARGDFRKDSDIDLFVNTTSEKEVEKVVRATTNQFEDRASKSWHLRGIKLPITCIVGDLDSKDWTNLKREIISSGITLFGKYRELPSNLKHYMYFKFDLSFLPPKDRVRFIRNVYGYTTKKEKTYEHTGLLEKVNGIKLGLAIVAVPIESYAEFYNFIKRSKVKFELNEIWM